MLQTVSRCPQLHWVLTDCVSLFAAALGVNRVYVWVSSVLLGVSRVYVWVSSVLLGDNRVYV